MKARVLVVLGLAALLIAADARGQSGGRLDIRPLVETHETGPTDVQLDADAAPERVVSRKLDEFRFVPRVEDDCLGARRIGPVNDNVAIDAVSMRGSATPALLWVSGSSGASGRVGDFRLHRLGPQTDGRGCPTLRTVFAFPDPKFALPRPRRGTDAGSFSAQLRFDAGAIAVRTFEGLYRANDGGCCPSFLRTSDWRFDPQRDRYVRTRSRTKSTG
jgi:hypothetical protein